MIVKKQSLEKMEKTKIYSSNHRPIINTNTKKIDNNLCLFAAILYQLRKKT